MDWALFIGFLTILLLIFIYKGISVYKTFKGTIYPIIYSSFVEYYYKYRYKHNLSQSRWLDHEIKTHRILFNSFLNEDKKVLVDFITIFHTKGIQVFAILKPDGIVSGKTLDKDWKFKKESKTYRFNNPTKFIDQYIKGLKELSKHDYVIDAVILFPDNATITDVKSSYPIHHYKDYLDILKNQSYSLTDEEVIKEYELVTKKNKE